MTVVDEVQHLRLVLGEPTTGGVYTDGQLLRIIRQATSVSGASALAWAIKAAGYVTLVDVSESGAERKLSQLATNALRMAKFWYDTAGKEDVMFGSLLRVGPRIGDPWSIGRSLSNVYVIGDASRGPSGLIYFVQVPIYLDEITGQEITGPPASSGGDTLFSSDDFNFKIERGTTWRMRAKYSTAVIADPDLSAWTVTMVIDPDSPSAITYTSAGPQLDPAIGGIVDFYLTAAETSALFEGPHSYVVRITDTPGNGDTYPFLHGIMEVDDL